MLCTEKPHIMHNTHTRTIRRVCVFSATRPLQLTTNHYSITSFRTCSCMCGSLNYRLHSNCSTIDDHYVHASHVSERTRPRRWRDQPLFVCAAVRCRHSYGVYLSKYCRAVEESIKLLIRLRGETASHNHKRDHIHTNKHYNLELINA